MSGRTFALCTIVVALTRDPLVVMLNATRFPFVSFLRPHLDTSSACHYVLRVTHQLRCGIWLNTVGKATIHYSRGGQLDGRGYDASAAAHIVL